MADEPLDQGVRPQWVYPPHDPEWKEKIINEFKIHPVIAQILVSRNFESLEEIHNFLYAKLPDLHNPNLLNQMALAVDRICLALKKKEAILIYGDNDVDGMSGTALLTEFLQLLDAKVFYFISIPGSQRDELIIESLKYAKLNNCKLLITVDCGITAAPEIEQVTREGIDVIITDHHEPTEEIPKCAAILNPKYENVQYPNRELTGVGVAFKLAHGLTNNLVANNQIPQKKIDLKRFLDLVALGTISDMGALRGENRILVSYGLRQLKKTKRVGLTNLISVAEVNLSEISSFEIATKIAPRLNSLGRIADPRKGVELLLVRNAHAAEKMAIELDLNNIERQKIDKVMSVDVENTILANPDILNHKAIVMSSDQWHPGIIAILSTRISKQYNRPTVMIAIENDLGKGSLRSTTEFPLLDVLKENASLFTTYGGHDFAAGLSLKADNIEEFKRRFIAAADEKLTDQDVKTKLQLDAKIDFEQITFDFMESFKLLEPYGNENPQPTLYCEATQAWPPKVVGKTHLKLYLEQNDRLLEGIAFGRGADSGTLKKKDITLGIACTPQINHFQGASIQLMVKDFKIKE